MPSHFKVKEYCPLVFRNLRERFGIDDASYMKSLTRQGLLNYTDYNFVECLKYTIHMPFISLDENNQHYLQTFLAYHICSGIVSFQGDIPFGPSMASHSKQTLAKIVPLPFQNGPSTNFVKVKIGLFWDEWGTVLD